MTNKIGSTGNGKEWQKVDATTKNTEYKQTLNEKIKSILNGNETISVEQLRNNSLFQNMSEKSLRRFYEIAKVDGDNDSFNAKELMVLFSLADASLQNNETFIFDGQYSVDENSGLEQATEKEISTMIKNIVGSDARKRYRYVDESKYDKSKDFASKITSDDIDESMIALQDRLKESGFTDKRSGKRISITQAVVILKDYVRKAGYSQKALEAFTETTGIPVSNYEQCRCPGDSVSFKMGDWIYNQGHIVNEKTGENLQVSSATWVNSTNHTVPAVRGQSCLIKEYRDSNGTIIKYNYGDEENIAPTSATITANGQAKDINYGNKFFIDPELYNFVER